MSRTSKRKRDARKRKRARSAPAKSRAVRGRYKLDRPWRLQVFPDGQRMILLRVEDAAMHSFYDDNDRRIPRADVAAHQGTVWIEAPPKWRGVRDWFVHEGHEGMGVSSLSETRYEAWRNTYAANKPFVNLPADDVPSADVAYLVAEGPSLERNKQELLRVKRGATVAINRTMKHLPPDTFDYFFAIDFLVDLNVPPVPPYNGPYPKTVALLDPCVNPTLLKYGWKEMRWFVPNYDMGHEVYDGIIEDNPQLPRYDMGLSASFQAIAWIGLSLFGIEPSNDIETVRAQAKGKTLVLVGQDCCFTWGRQRAGKWLTYKDVIPGEIKLVADVDGRLVMTTGIYQSQAHWLMAACYFCRDAGIRVINATEGGLLHPHVNLNDGTKDFLADVCEQRLLADVVDELNGGG